MHDLATAASTGLIVRSERPFNAEPPLARLAASFVTPVRDFYVRSHGAVPRPDPETWRLKISGEGVADAEYTLADLRGRFRCRRIVAALQCAGNRRAELSAVRPAAGVQWGAGAIGNAEWAGAPLADVLAASGVEDRDGLHVSFACHDEIEHEGCRTRYGVSISIVKALSPDVLLAYAMNGADLTAEHGYPLRLVVPGYAGVRSAKWLDRIVVGARPSDNPMQQRDYKLFPPGVSKDTADWSRGTVIEELPLNAAICAPAAGTVLFPGEVEVSGYAVASGRGVARVEVSADNGGTWSEAELETRSGEPWSWVLWRARVHLERGRREIAVRAWDTAGQTQPARAEELWNFKGYCCAAWHRVGVEVGSAASG